MSVMTDISSYIVGFVFFFQITFVSIFISAGWRKSRLKLLQTYPQNTFPNLYAQSNEVEAARIKARKYLDYVIAGIGFTLLTVFMFQQATPEEIASLMIYFAALQIQPLVLSAFWCQKNANIMAKRYPEKKRATELHLPSIEQYVRPVYLILLATLYLISLVFAVVVYTQQMWGDDSYRALLLVALSTIVMLCIGYLAYKQLYGKRKNHFIDQEERIEKRSNSLKHMVRLNILYCAFIIVIQLINTFEVNGPIVSVLASVLFQMVVFTTRNQYYPVNPNVYR